MTRVLVAVDSSRSCQFAVKHVIREAMNNKAMEVHLLNIQRPFTMHVARFVSRKTLDNYHRDAAKKALEPIKQMLDSFGVPYCAHAEVGNQAECITDTARRLRCDQIVMSTARKNSLTRLIANSVTNEVLALTTVPVKVIVGDETAGLERYVVPAAIGTAAALLIIAMD